MGVIDRLRNVCRKKKKMTWRVVAPSKESGIAGLVVCNGMLYGGGGSTGNLYQWDSVNLAWTLVVVGAIGTSVRDLVVLNNQIYGGMKNGALYRFNEATSAWIQVAAILGGESLGALAVYNGKIYGGTDDSALLYEWNGVNAWSSVANLGGSITSLAVFNGKLYGGASTSGRLVEWNGTNAWVVVAPQLSTGYISSLAVYQNSLYAGLSAFASGSAKLIKWNGVNAWKLVAETIPNESTLISMLVFNDNLYVATSDNAGVLYELSIRTIIEQSSENTSSSLVVTDSTGTRVSTVRHTTALIPWTA